MDVFFVWYNELMNSNLYLIYSTPVCDRCYTYIHVYTLHFTCIFKEGIIIIARYSQYMYMYFVSHRREGKH